MGLKFTDIEKWHKWQASRRKLHSLKDKLSPGGDEAQPAIELWVRGHEPELLIACDSDSPTNYHSLLDPLSLLPDLPVIVAKPENVDLVLPPGDWRRRASVDLSVRRVASIGDHLRVGAWARGLSAIHGWEQLIVQHGLLTPFAPPPPPGSHVLAWSELDAEYVREGRTDLETSVVGSPLLWNAQQNPAPHISRFERPVFLGQLHGSELPRTSKVKSVTAFWRETNATYRPHPREEDKLSRIQHARWRRMGMEIDGSGRLSELDRPVVSAFSTGVLEAAVRGIPAWVHHLNPPAWLEEFWDRYGLARWGDAQTTAPALKADPSASIAQALEGSA